MTRLYLPATLALLAELDRTGRIPVGDDVVLATDDSEDAEYDALMTAAETSARLARRLGPGMGRRVVVVAEVPTVGGHVAVDEVVAVHADDGELSDLTEPAELDELGWYATQEIPYLLGLH